MASFASPMRVASTNSTTGKTSNNSQYGLGTPASAGLSTSVSGTNTPSIRSQSVSMPISAGTMTNKQASSEDSLYYICLRLMNSMAKVPGMLPYIELAYQQADIAAEEQAMSISANIGELFDSNSNSNSNNSNSSTLNMENNGSSRSSNGATSRNVSSSLDINHNNHNGSGSRSISNRSSTPTFSSNANSTLLSTWNDSLHTFSTGLLPAQISYDPVTPLSKLFKHGSSLCLLFNALSPENAIEVASSDDLKICKMNIYLFLTACKQHLNIRDDELFPVTMVQSDNTTHLLRVIHSIEFVLNLEPSFISPPIPDQIKITDSRSKIIKELVETERRFVQDLEMLVRYRDDVVSSQIIPIEDVNMLFPNLNDIIDFQRKFLVGLESNAIAPPKYQRIGSVFVHAGVESFKIYENWSLYQSFANELIRKEAHKLKSVSSLIKDPYELQNFFLIKPIQRLTKYPLLLSQLLKETDPSWPNYNELHQAYLVSKEVALGINEAQRRSENVKHLNELKDRVIDWKGYTTNNIGDLLYFNVVTVKDLLTDGHSNEKEVHCYLFEKVVYFFKEVSHGKNKLLGSKKMSNLAFPSNDSNHSLGNGSKTPVQLSLNGIVYISKIYKISPSDSSPYFPGVQGHFLTLRWKGNKDTGGCIMKFRSEEQLKQWNNTIKKLSMDIGSNGSYDEGFYSSHHNNTKSMSSLSSAVSVITGGADNRSSSTTTSTNNRNSDRLRSSSDSTSFMKKMRSTSSSSFSNLANINYPPLPTEKTLRSLSISSNNNNGIKSNANDFIHAHKQSSSYSSIAINEELQSNFSNLTLSKPPSNSSDNTTNIKLTFNKGKSIINLSVNSDTTYENLVALLVKKMNYNMGSDNLFSTSNISLKFKDEDGDHIRFQGNDDWSIAKEMLEDLDPDSRILELSVL